MFHLFTHAFFKALLFLGAGSVSHSGSHHSFDMKKDMGGLRKYMPITFWTFMIGTLALAGIFPLRRLLVEGRDPRSPPAQSGLRRCFLVIGLVGAFLTAAYMTRCVYLTFFGEYRGHGHPHESPKPRSPCRSSSSPVFAIAGRLPQRRRHPASRSSPSASSPRVVVPATLVHPEFDYPAGGRSRSSVAALGIGIAAYFWFEREELRRAQGPHRSATSSRTPGYTFLVNKYYLDDLYEDVIVGGIKGPIARGAYWVNQNVIDGVVNGAGTARRAVGRFAYDDVDQKVRRRRGQRRRPSHRREPAASCATSRPAGSSGTRCSCSVRSGVLAVVLLLANV